MQSLDPAENDFIVSGANNSAEAVKILPKEGMQCVQDIDTEGHTVYAACLLGGSQKGISLAKSQSQIKYNIQTLILGCDGGHVVKYEKQFNVDQWKWAGKLKLTFKVWDVLQSSLSQVLVC